MKKISWEQHVQGQQEGLQRLADDCSEETGLNLKAGKTDGKREKQEQKKYPGIRLTLTTLSSTDIHMTMWRLGRVRLQSWQWQESSFPLQEEGEKIKFGERAEYVEEFVDQSPVASFADWL